MPRFYLNEVTISPGTTLDLPEDVSRHVQVLRLKVGDQIQIFNGKGGEFRASVAEIGKKSVSVDVLSFEDCNRESPLQLTLVQALSATERMDYTVQKASELGVTRLQVVVSSFCAYKLGAERAEKRMAHWRANATSAAEQCGRTGLLQIDAPLPLDAWLVLPNEADLRLLLSPVAGVSLQALPPQANRIEALIGPEGGFSAAEEQAARAAGYTALQLGPRIFRTETVAPVIAALMQARYGDFI